ncbi:4Fe-4S binding protein [Lacihabitans sp. CCS-44]|uniref:4Fe-4S binding protein n=1 Tax=Lacihabitans sp. CCS-44 TaxID=2487331 RepID=UPI0020CDC397|nr:4Fe-4S dicluster domain-containing protein [Lacihabitans sp. CCS-44]MCP9756909.1 4Fe-4S binding protein [Lacihabitans sp. CCS-44]
MKLEINKSIGLSLGFGGMIILVAALFNLLEGSALLYLSLCMILTGIVVYSFGEYSSELSGIKNNEVWFKSVSSKGIVAWILGFVLTAFYIVIYWFPEYLGLKKEGNTGLVAFFDPLSFALNGHGASQWFVYGTLYTIAILGFGVKFILKYRHNTYQIVRTSSVMFFQLGFAFLLPEFLAKLNPKLDYFAKDIKNMWPLNYYFFEDWHLKAMLGGGNLGMFMLFFGIGMIFLISPILTYFFGKRWYCSWVCGCGGLAETAGDSFRQLSDKSVKAWKIERWMIHSVLLFVFITTVAVIYSFLINEKAALNPQLFLVGVIIFLGVFSLYVFKIAYKKLALDARKGIYWASGIISTFLIINMAIGNTNVFFIDSYTLRSWYGFFIGAAFSGVVGVGFYPILGSRVWCRFGCPMAAILGFQQKLLSRFRITTNGSQCISCGNCSTYCEMGIDVRAYAQKGEDIVRSSCVGCGVCSAVCPRGVLKLENGRVEI